ncbi:MAG: flagellar motor switch protein FliG [Actinomycetota bacterium]
MPQGLLDLANTDAGALTSRQKAAVLLVSVGPAEAANVLAYLTEEEVEMIAAEISRLGAIPPPLMTAVLEDFHLQAVANQYMLEGGLDYARELLMQWKGEKGEEIIQRLIATAQIAPFAFLSKLEPEQLLQFLKDEHPQTVALVFAYLPSTFSARLLAGLPEEQQTEVSLRIATMDRTSPDVIRRVEDSLKMRMGSISSSEMGGNRGGAEDLAELLNSAGRAVEKLVLDNLTEVEPELAEQVRALMFVFEDIVEMSDRDLQEMLRTIDGKTLALATKGVKEPVRQKVFSNLSERASNTLKEEIEYLGAVKLSEVESAQSAIVAEIRRLDEEGRISMRPGSDGGFIE